MFKNNIKKIILAFSLGIFYPIFAFAQNQGGIKSIVVTVGNIINHILIPMAGALALLFFFYGLAKFVFKLGNGDENAVEEGQNIMKWGIVSLFVILSIWGIVSVIKSDLGIPEVQDISAPAIPRGI